MKKTLIILTVLIMALTICGCHKHKWLAADCSSPQTCEDCNATTGSALGHNWIAATCTSPKICLDCGTSEGLALEHTWIEATCITLKTCSVCGEKEGTLANHEWKSATCISPKTCHDCGTNEGLALGHTWIEATCTAPKTCSVCGEKEDTLANHEWKNATCTSPKTCIVCGDIEGSVTSHNWKVATCTSPKTCSACGQTEGSAKGHNWETLNVYSKKCKTCGAKEIDHSKAPVSLGHLTPCTGKNYYKESYHRKDIYGNEFSEGLYIQFYSHNTYNTEYVLNKEYKKFTTTLMVSSTSHEKFEGRLKIYVDDILVYESNILNIKTQPSNIEIDISNAMFIKIVASGNTSNFESGYVMLSDPTLHH